MPLLRNLLLLALPLLPGPAVAGELPLRHFEAAPADQSIGDVSRKSIGCLGCHERTDAMSMHDNPAVKLGCTDCPRRGCKCHSAARARQAGVGIQPASGPGTCSAALSAGVGLSKKRQAATQLHLAQPRIARFHPLCESRDYRVATQACGACHLSIIAAAQRSLMATGAMLLGGASYNNGVLPFKRYILGEAYTSSGQAAGIEGPPLPDPAGALSLHGVLPRLQAVQNGRQSHRRIFFGSLNRGDAQPATASPRSPCPTSREGCRTSLSPGAPTCTYRIEAREPRDESPFRS